MIIFLPLKEGNSPTLGKTGAVDMFSLPPLLQMHSGLPDS